MMIQSVRRALDILHVVASHDDWIGVREIARRVDLKVPTTQQLLKTLEAANYLEFDAELRKYRIGVAPIVLANAIDPVAKIREFARSSVTRLQQELGETVVVLVWRTGRALVADWRESGKDLTVAAPRSPFLERPHLMASGLILLAWQPEEVQERYAANQCYEPPIANSSSSPEQLLRTLHDIRGNGYASTRDVDNSGIAACGAPVFGPSGKLMFALGASCPLQRFDETVGAAMLRSLQREARGMALS